MGRNLVLAEKPSVARDYAAALNCKNTKDGYIENDKYVITWAVGHFLTLKEPGDYNEKYKKWNLDDLPIVPEKFGLKLIKGVSKQFNIIKSLVERNDIDGVIIGTDAGREGEAIARYILHAARNQKPVQRLWISSMTPEDIKRGFNNLEPSGKYDNLYYSAQARSEIDWLLGLNYTRAYTVKKGNNVLLSIGRCQTPILNLIVERDKAINDFKPIPYYQVKTNFTEYEGMYIINDNIIIDNIETAKAIAASVEGKTGTIHNIEKEEKREAHPQLYNLTNLSKVMNTKYGFSAKKTLDVAQELYEKHKILSYPRTSSRHLSQSHISEFPERLRVLSFGQFNNAIDKLNLADLKVTKRFIDDSKLSDHHAIIPTLKSDMADIYKGLTDDEKKLFDEVALTFISCFYSDYKYERTVIMTKVGEHEFKTVGRKEIEKGWKEIYQDAAEENESLEDEQMIPDLQEGQEYKVAAAEILSKKTKAPSKHTEASLLAQLEKFNIGTEATRANLIETLLNRDYIQRDKKKLISTQLGQDLIKVIDSDELKSVELTSILENKLEDIASGKISKASIVNETIEKLKVNIKALIESSGGQIERKNEVLGNCPKCNNGHIVEKKNGYGCDTYSQSGCDFFIGKEIAGTQISSGQVKKLLDKNKTDIIKGFKAKDGNQEYDARLVLIDNQVKIERDRPSVLGECPLCHKGQIKENKAGYGCTGWQQGCKIFIPKEMAGKKLTETQIKKLIEKGETDLIKGFKKTGGKEFNSILILDSEGKTKFKKYK